MSRLDSPDFMKNATDKYNPPAGVNMSKPSIARVYSYYLGGKDHFQVDREMADYAEGVVPVVTDLALGNRAFVQRAVRYLAGAGVRQFLDIGSGLPSDGNVHEIAHEIAPDAHVVYVDNDPMVLAHARALLSDNDTTAVITADLTDPQGILRDAATERLLDLKRPLGLMLGGILHHLGDAEEPDRIARELREALAPGSYLVISHFCQPDEKESPDDAEHAVALQEAFLDKLGTGIWREYDIIRAYFGDWELLEPGLVNVDDWHPLPRSSKIRGTSDMPDLSRRLIVGGIARKPS